MKVLLARPENEDVYSLFHKMERNRVMPPLGLMYIDSYLFANGHESRIWDGCISDQSFEKAVVDYKPDIVGIGATTPEFYMVEDLFDIAKKVSKEILTVAGGFHFTALPHEDYRNVDYVITGDGEFAMKWLADGNRPKEKVIEGIRIDDLDSIPIPRWNRIEDWYYSYMFDGKLEDAVMMTTSRGCPYQCIFCHNSKNPRPVRFRSIENVLMELDALNIMGINRIIFADENFALEKERTIEMCSAMKDYNLQWACLMRADQVNESVIKAMVDVGCKEISIGVETGNSDIMTAINKRESLDNIQEAFEILKDFEVEKRASFIIGHPYETWDSAKDTIKFACSLPIDRAFFNIMTPYPSSIVYDLTLNDQGMSFVDTDWRSFKRYGRSTIRTPGLSASNIEQLQKDAHRTFYTQKRIILEHIMKLIGNDEEKEFYNRPLIDALKWEGTGG